ncbi:MAG: prolyl oligopeptidase family serine peptidase, partial [Halobacteriovoraceae bacterium]|nr:prolyl oligopeptidase family serine peptidase [Halobacteriovoraceae bacterium]
LESAELVLEEDFSKRTFFNLAYSEIHEKLLIESDHAFDEKLNLYQVSKDKMEQLTETPYLGVFGFNEDETLLAYASRHGKDEKGYLSTFKIKNIETGEDEVLFEDKELDYRLGWGSVLFLDNDQKLIIACDYKNQRRKNNFFLYDRKTSELELLIPDEDQVAGMMLLRGSQTENGFSYVSDKTGTDAVYWYDFKTKKVKELYVCKDDAHNFAFSSKKKTFAASVSDRRNNKSTIVLIKLNEDKAEILQEKPLEGTVYIAKFNELLWLQHTSLTTPTTITSQTIDSSLSEKLKLPFYKKDIESFLDFDYEYVEYDTFDGQKVPALLTLPKGEIKALYIVSFYGGDNTFSKADAIFAKNGIACLSPAVRGSWSYGKKWRDQIKGDLGGAEIVDLIWGAKFAEKRLGLKPSQIGVSGGSHGGYATLRALTFPSEFKGVDTSYDWGFGICSAGFADLEQFYKVSNIPDWLDDMLGNYKDNVEKYRERSPLFCFDRLRAPTMIEHGTNDARVPYSTMQPFVEKLKASGVPHEVMIKEGSGHNYSSAKEEAEVYSREINFILQTQ